jgi:hypothetical protein
VNDDTIPSKLAWKSLIRGSLQDVEQRKWSEMLSVKQANRYHNIQPYLTKNIIYDTTERNIHMRSHLQLLIKILSVPENYYLPMMCELCNRVVTDSVEHIFMRCEQLVDQRNALWDGLLDSFGVSAEVDLFNREDGDILEILLGKKWSYLEYDNTSDIDNLFMHVAGSMNNFIRSMKVDNRYQKDSILQHLTVMKVVL